jgi:predicted Zn finger-like uncharacterized protein
MILTCPNCSARFMIDGHALGEGGRTVRCGACGHSWLQLPEPAMAEPGAEPAAAFEPAPPPVPAEAGPPPLPEAPLAPDEKIRRGRRREQAALAEAGAAPKRSRGLTRVLVWFLFVFVVAALVLGGYRFRHEVVRLWPPAMKLYEVIGLTVDPPSGYFLRVPQDSLRFRRDSDSGVPILVVSGEIHNSSDKPQRVAPMRVVLLDKENRPLRTERLKIEERVVEPGGRAPFKVSISNPPPEASAVRITFDPGGG